MDASPEFRFHLYIREQATLQAAPAGVPWLWEASNNCVGNPIMLRWAIPPLPGY